MVGEAGGELGLIEIYKVEESRRKLETHFQCCFIVYSKYSKNTERRESPRRGRETEERERDGSGKIRPSKLCSPSPWCSQFVN